MGLLQEGGIEATKIAFKREGVMLRFYLHRERAYFPDIIKLILHEEFHGD